MGVRPHDLLRLTSAEALEAVDPPQWVAEALAATPWVVTRRAGEARGRIAVGVRGATRGERFAAFLPPSGVAETARPEDLAGRAGPRAHPAFEAIALLRPMLERLGPWGPAGAAGFELATGRRALTAESDLDLVLRLDAPPQDGALARLASAAAEAPLRVDILLELPRGAVALDDFRSTARDILLRTGEGPRLVARDALWASPC